jgi:hypothetical protein
MKFFVYIAEFQNVSVLQDVLKTQKIAEKYSLISIWKNGMCGYYWTFQLSLEEWPEQSMKSDKDSGRQ